jgi:hypothetical protein
MAMACQLQQTFHAVTEQLGAIQWWHACEPYNAFNSAIRHAQ